MPRYRVIRRIDAFVDEVAEIEAGSPEQAAQLANKREEKYEWKGVDVHYFDPRVFVTLDDAGNEIDSTRVGDFD